MKKLIALTLFILTSLGFISCGNDNINNYLEPEPDFDIYLVKWDFQKTLFSTYIYKFGGSEIKLLNDSMLVNNYSFNNKILLSKNYYYTEKIYIADHDGSNMTEIPLGHDYYSNFNLSPDASKMFFISDNPGYFLYIINTNGTDLALISDYNYNSQNIAKFSPNSKLIAYFKPSHHQFAVKLFISNTRGTYKKEIKDSINSRAGVELDWSPDGSKVIYHNYSINEQVGKICVVDTANSIVTVLGNGYFPAWSPNGSKICFMNFSGSSSDLFLMNPDGTNIVNISNTPNASENNIKWSKDGTRILYNSYEGSNPSKLWLYDLNTNSNTFIADSVYDAIWR